MRRALRQDSSLNIVALQDAAKEMWTLLTGALEAEPSVTSWEEMVDRYHAMGHLWAAAQAMEGDADVIMARWKAALRHEDDAIDAIADELRGEVTRGYRARHISSPGASSVHVDWRNCQCAGGRDVMRAWRAWWGVSR